MECSFCGSQEDVDEETLLCKVCLSAFEKNQAPPIDFKRYFSSRLEKKLKQIDSLLLTLPENFFLWYLKGHLEHELGESKKALRSINTSISYKKDFGDSWIRLGLIYSDMHRESEARDDFQRGLRYPLYDPSNLIDAGAALQASDQPIIAAKILQRALDLVPDDDRGLMALSKVLIKSGKLEEAKKIMERAVELYPHNEEILRGMAQTMMGLDDLESAMDMYSRILDQHPRDFEALLGKAEIYLQNGQLTLALKSYMAVRDLDVQISWGGILRFIVSSIRSLIGRNENHPSYREDLKKEYRNIELFLEELDEKVHSSKGPEMLDELESLMKVIENMRISQKEQIGQYEELLEKYKVDDPFHLHLQKKVSSLKHYHSKMRFFDGKQISLELSPFLTDLGKMDSRTEGRLRTEIEKRFDELNEVGLMDTELHSKMEEVDKLEEEGNIEGASFLLKEIQISLDEQWQDDGRKYFNGKAAEMEGLLKKGKEQFDTSGLKKKFKEFKKMFKKGPIAVRNSYLEFTKTYAEDSENYFQKEVERTLREIQYKIIILEKDGSSAKTQKRKLKELRKRFDNGERPIELHQETMDLLSKVSNIELKQKIALTREKLMDLDKLLGDVDALGMDEEIARNVEPVRRVIERSLKNENYRLSDILTSELYDNVEKLLKDNYIDDLKNNMYESLGEIDRLRKLGVQEIEWDSLLDMSRRILESDEISVPLIPIVNCLAELQTLIQNFYVERLTGEIDDRILRLKKFVSEGVKYGFDLNCHIEQLDELEKRAEEISSLEMLEESVSLESQLEVKIKDLLANKVRSINGKIKKDVDQLTEEGANQKAVMVVLSKANRAEMLLEVGREREAYKKIMGSKTKLESIDNDLKDRKIKAISEQIEKMLESANIMGVKMDRFKKKYLTITMNDPTDRLEQLSSLEKLEKSSRKEYDLRIQYLYEELETSADNIYCQAQGILPNEDVQAIKEYLDELKKIIASGDMTMIPDHISETENIIESRSKKIVELSLLSKCSILIEEGLSLNDDRASDIVKKIQKIAGRIRKGDLDESDKEIQRLEKEIGEIRSIHHIQHIETMLKEIGDLDDIATNIFKEIEDKELNTEKRTITNKIEKLIDSTSILYSDPDPETIVKMNDTISQTREDMIHLENKWRACKRIRSLKEMGVFDIKINNKLVQKDIDNLMDIYEQDDLVKFFRVWERVEGKLDTIKRQIVMESTTREGGEAMDVLVRGKGKKKNDLAENRERTGGLAGIQRLAQDMGEKRKRLERTEGPGEGTSKDIKEGSNSGTLTKVEGETDISSIAKTIAGERIKKLEKMDRDKACGKGGKHLDLPWSKDKDLDLKGLSSMIKDLDSIEGSKEAVDAAMTEAERIRDRLDGFYNKLPQNLSLDESFSKYEKGVENMNGGDHNAALREFRLATSSAVKMAKLHTEITKAISSINRELSVRRKMGETDPKAERIYIKAENALKNGELADCATLIKAIKNILFN